MRNTKPARLIVRELVNKVGNSIIQLINTCSTQDMNKIVRTGKIVVGGFFNLFYQENKAKTIMLCEGL